VGRYPSLANPRWYYSGEHLYVRAPIGLTLDKVTVTAVIASPVENITQKKLVGNKTLRTCDLFTKPLDIHPLYMREIRKQILALEANIMVNGLRINDQNNNANPQ
jgi:hypothetical protein